ncbi:Arylsulfatase [Sedimentisphaera cyanobacteriorum]|uniref:Arylsulfatase n=1 Tax=Sedimentisphaera cyanobacteriorum TaxID=1940790 RepID=A0A1Q2HS90_9BACT|nr:arylsulfatase [Sedimentisphaera cyanobacteriorum]AQQ10329.1 Arylsulfatase [Sedimentisphaera cyanobacteriorum]
MKRRTFLAGCALSSISLTAGLSLAEKRKKKPNILLIMADDMGYSDIGCYGGEIETPNLDRLAGNGLRFTQFYNAARCCPTRASLLTGLYPHQADVGHMVYRDQGKGYHGKLNKQCVTLGEVMKNSGYQTMMSGKWHVGHSEDVWPSNRGFDKFYGIHLHVDSYFKVLKGCDVYKNGRKVIKAADTPANRLHPDQEWYTTNVFTDHAIKFLDEAEKDKPFFLYAAYNAPHWPLEAPDKTIQKYRGKYMHGWEALRKDKIERMKKLGIIKENWQLSKSDAPEWESLSEDDRKNLDFRRAIYAAQIDNMDQNIGRLIKKLEEKGELENTLVLFLSDNGCSAEPERKMFGYRFRENRIENFRQWRKDSGRSSSQGMAWANVSNTPFRKYKKWTHEGGIATPLIAHWPEVIKNGGQLNHTPGHVADIMATAVDVGRGFYPKKFGGNEIKPMEGTSLKPAFDGSEIKRENPIFWEHEGNWAIREDKWKLVCDGPKGKVELYDLENDRTELSNLAEAKPDKVKELTEKWHKWAKRADVLPWPYKPQWQADI